MKFNKYLANGYISNYIVTFNKNIEVLLEKKIKTIEPSVDKSIFLKDLREYESLKEYLREILNEIEFINENYLFYKLTGYVSILFEKYYHIINMK